ncbi:MAG: hypothetical protein EOL88_14800, partial [Bacteroidia bacterium]|nr:hypothetical protein [Bacteroidia bacterium]
LMQKNTYENGMVSGRLTRWHPNGNKELEEEYENNLRNGLAVYYNQEGQKIREVNYKHDTLHGSYVEFFASGHIKIEGEYKNGLFHGAWKWYDEDGVVLGEGNFERGNGTQTAWRRDGTLLREITYQNNQKHGVERHYNEEEKVEKEIINRKNEPRETEN